MPAQEARDIAEPARSQRIGEQLEEIFKEISVRAGNGYFVAYWHGDLFPEVREKCILLGYKVETVNETISGLPVNAFIWKE